MNILNYKGLKKSEPLCRHTSWRIGGPAEYFFQPENNQELKSFLKKLNGEKNITVIGQGSNLLVRDGGLDDVVIALKNKGEIKLINHHTIYADALINCAKFARFASSKNLYGAEFLMGIPGSIGGALAMNAGSFGCEIWQLVKKLKMINDLGQTRWANKDDFDVSYRNVKLKQQEWFLGAEFILEKEQKIKIKELLEIRKKNQPIGSLSCGSVFKNPPNNFAAKLLDECNMKGVSIGGACISDKHANFIINKNNAKAQDVENLISLMREQVYSKFKIKLELEVKIIGKKC